MHGVDLEIKHNANAPPLKRIYFNVTGTERLGLERDKDGPASYRLAYFQLSAGKMTVWKRDAHPDAVAMLNFIGCGV